MQAACATPDRCAPRGCVKRWLRRERRRHAASWRSAPGSKRTHAARPVITLAAASVYVDARRLLRDLDFTVRRGECWVLHGGNGAGKSTLLRTLYGDHAVASGGRITRAGQVPGVPLDDFRARTGLVAPHLQTDYPRHCSVADVVVSGLHSSIGLNFRATAIEQRRAASALRSLGMEAFAARPLAELSYGQVRRVLFARAVVASRACCCSMNPSPGSMRRCALNCWPGWKRASMPAQPW